MIPTTIRFERLRGRERSQHVSDCRRCVVARLHEHGYGCAEIGRRLNRHHTTIIYLLRSHHDLMQSSAEYRRLYEHYCEEYREE